MAYALFLMQTADMSNQINGKDGSWRLEEGS